MDARVWFEHLSDPALVLTASGQTRQANRALRDLAARHNVSPTLEQLLGPEGVSALLVQARHRGAAQTHLPAVVGQEPRPIFRVAMRRIEGQDDFTVLLVDMAEEIAWREELAARAHELSVLHDIGAALSATLDPDTLAERIHEQTTRIITTGTFYLAIYDPETRMISFPIYIEDHVRAHAEHDRRPPGNGMTEYVMRTKRPLLINRDVSRQAESLGIQPLGRPAQSWLGVPMLADGEAIGVIAVQDYELCDRYTPHDVEVLTIIAGQAAAALKNARLLTAARRAFEHLSQAQARLLESERLCVVTETVGALNHEINNPLATISGNAQLLLRQRHVLPAAAHEKVARIQEAAQRIQQVTGKMSNLIQATSMPYPGNVSILDLIRSIARDEADSAPGGAGGATGTDG